MSKEDFINELTAVPGQCQSYHAVYRDSDGLVHRLCGPALVGKIFVALELTAPRMPSIMSPRLPKPVYADVEIFLRKGVASTAIVSLKGKHVIYDLSEYEGGPVATDEDISSLDLYVLSINIARRRKGKNTNEHS